MWITIGIIVVIVVILGFLFWRNKKTKNGVVPVIDLNQYAGIWYENARLPVSYQEGCKNSTARYTLRPDNTLGVINKCELDGRIVEVRGIAIPNNSTIDPNTKILKPGRLKVVFENSPVSGDYNILYIDHDYQYSIVGTPDKKSLWILARMEKLSNDIYRDLVERAKKMGYNVNALIKN